jgi:SOS-response transcriptional repressor LexA
MRKDSRRPQVLDAFRAHVEASGRAPTFRELGDAVGISSVAAWKNVQALIYEGKLERTARGAALPNHHDVSNVPTDDLRGELARRGFTMDALETPTPLFGDGQPCAANHCRSRVKRGQLMCRQHWFQLPPAYRSDIMNAWAARHVQAFQEALEAARNYLGGYTNVAERVA